MGYTCALVYPRAHVPFGVGIAGALACAGLAPFDLPALTRRPHQCAFMLWLACLWCVMPFRYNTEAPGAMGLTARHPISALYGPACEHCAGRLLYTAATRALHDPTLDDQSTFLNNAEVRSISLSSTIQEAIKLFHAIHCWMHTFSPLAGAQSRHPWLVPGHSLTPA